MNITLRYFGPLGPGTLGPWNTRTFGPWDLGLYDFWTSYLILSLTSSHSSYLLLHLLSLPTSFMFGMEEVGGWGGEWGVR